MPDILVADIFLAICFIFSLGIGVFVYVYLNKGKKSPSEKNANRTNENIKKEGSLKKLFQIKDINNGIIKLFDGGYRMIFSISSPDFELLTDEEQETFENSLMQFSLSLSFPIQFFTTTLKVETSEPAKALEKVIYDEDIAISNELKEYATKLKEKLYDMEREESYVRKSYCILAVNGINDSKRALNELNNRMQTVFSGLTRCGMRVCKMNSLRILQLFHDIFNKESNIKVDELISGQYGGVLDLYSQGIGGVVDEEER